MSLRCHYRKMKFCSTNIIPSQKLPCTPEIIRYFYKQTKQENVKMMSKRHCCHFDITGIYNQIFSNLNELGKTVGNFFLLRNSC